MTQHVVTQRVQTQRVDCAGDAIMACPHRYAVVSTATARCVSCGRITRTDAHAWISKTPRAPKLCHECFAMLLPDWCTTGNLANV